MCVCEHLLLRSSQINITQGGEQTQQSFINL